MDISQHCCVVRSPAEGIAQRCTGVKEILWSSLRYDLHLIPDTDVTDNKANKISGFYVMLVGN